MIKKYQVNYIKNKQSPFTITMDFNIKLDAGNSYQQYSKSTFGGRLYWNFTDMIVELNHNDYEFMLNLDVTSEKYFSLFREFKNSEKLLKGPIKNIKDFKNSIYVVEFISYLQELKKHYRAINTFEQAEIILCTLLQFKADIAIEEQFESIIEGRKKLIKDFNV